MEDKFLSVMQQSLKTMSTSMEASKYICDSYRKIIRLIVVGFTLCIIIISLSSMYSTYMSYNYEGYPETDINNTTNNNNTNTNTSGKE